MTRYKERPMKRTTLQDEWETTAGNITGRVSEYEPIRGPGFVLVRSEGWGDTRVTSDGFVDFGDDSRPAADVLAALDAAGYLQAWHAARF